MSDKLVKSSSSLWRFVSVTICWNSFVKLNMAWSLIDKYSNFARTDGTDLSSSQHWSEIISSPDSLDSSFSMCLNSVFHWSWVSLFSLSQLLMVRRETRVMRDPSRSASTCDTQQSCSNTSPVPSTRLVTDPLLNNDLMFSLLSSQAMKCISWRDENLDSCNISSRDLMFGVEIFSWNVFHNDGDSATHFIFLDTEHKHFNVWKSKYLKIKRSTSDGRSPIIIYTGSHFKVDCFVWWTTVAWSVQYSTVQYTRASTLIH